MASLLGGGGLGGAQVCPVDVGAQVLATDSAAGLTIQVDAEAFTKALPLADGLAQIALRGFAARHQYKTIRLWQAVEVGE